MTIEINKLKPLNGNILVVDDKQEEKTSSGIYVPQTKVDEIKTGEVLEVSSRVTDEGVTIEPDVKKGDKVLYRNVAGAGNCFDIDGGMYRVLKPVELLAVVE